MILKQVIRAKLSEPIMVFIIRIRSTNIFNPESPLRIFFPSFAMIMTGNVDISNKTIKNKVWNTNERIEILNKKNAFDRGSKLWMGVSVLKNSKTSMKRIDILIFALPFL